MATICQKKWQPSNLIVRVTYFYDYNNENGKLTNEKKMANHQISSPIYIIIINAFIHIMGILH